MTKRPQLIALTLYTFFTLILLYPVPLQLYTHIAGFAGEDNLQWRWYLWWSPYAWLTLHQPASQVSMLFAPTGGEQPLYQITPLLPALAMPLTLTAGATVSFNLMLLLGFILSGYTAYLLIYALLPPHSVRLRHCAAFLGGLIFTFYPAHVGYATGSFLGQVNVYLLPLYLLALTRLTRAPRPRHYIWSVACATLLMLTWPLHVAYGLLPFTLMVLLSHRQARIWARVGFILTVTGGLILPFYYPLLRSFWSGQQKHLGGETATLFSIDLLAFFTPSNHHPWLAPLGLLPPYTAQVLRDYNDIHERLAYLGLGPLFLATIGLAIFRPRLTRWLIMAVLAAVLSLGPLLKWRGALYQLNIEGQLGYILLPYAGLQGLPILDWSAVLGRLNVITMLALAVMAAHGAYVGLRARPVPLTALFTLLILAEYATIFPFPMELDHVPAYYAQLAQTPSPQKVIELPLGQPAYQNYSLHYQTVHHQPVLGGHFMRTPAGTRQMVAFVQTLLAPPPATAPVFSPPDDPTRRALIAQLGFTQIIARPWLMTTPTDQAQWAYVQTWLGGFQSQGEVQTYALPTATTAPPPLTALLKGQAWAANEERMVLTQTASMLVYAATAMPTASLRLSLTAPQPDRYLVLTLDDQPLSRVYLAAESLHYNVPLALSAGAHEIAFWPDDSCRSACAPVTLTELQLVPQPALRWPTTQPLAPIQLHGFDLTTETAAPGQPVLLYLYWQSQAEVDQNLSVFVQLLTATDTPLLQADYLLGGWSMPTSTWAVGQGAAMPTLFFIPPQTPHGQYRLQTGLYQPDSGQRLTTLDLTLITVQ